MLSTLLFALALTVAAPTPDYLVDAAVVGCAQNRTPDAERVAALFELERAAGVPPAARGLLAAAACRESGYRADPRGHNDGGKARGMMQFWGWAKRWIRLHGGRGPDPRLDWRASASYWIAHVAGQVPRVRRHCRGRRGFASVTEQVWASANLTAVRRPRRDGLPRCAIAGRRVTNHWRVLVWFRRAATHLSRSLARGDPPR